MKFHPRLCKGKLLRRYKRFLADVELEDGSCITAHTANTGAMSGCSEPGSPVWLSRSDNPKRKYPFSWELVQVQEEGASVLVGINTMRSNALVKEAIQQGVIASLEGYTIFRTEVPYGKGSRIDLLLQDNSKPSCYVEVKNVTLVKEGVAYFPDAVSARALKHIKELIGVVAQGERAMLVFCVQRQDAKEFRPAEFVDPQYAAAFYHCLEQGVEAVAIQASISPEEIILTKEIPVL